MRSTLIAACLVISTGTACYADKPEIAGCEAVAVSTLRSPSSYVRIKTSYFENSVVVEYDAQNGYGALIRSTHQCLFRYYDGVFTFSPSRSARQGGGELLAYLGAANSVSVDAKSTQLKPSMDDDLLNSCIEIIIHKKSIAARPPVNDIKASFIRDGDSKPRAVIIRPTKIDSGMPRETTCTGAAKDIKSVAFVE
ncbi:hypothetical protein [Limoniibacter endophyticus]|uniref:Uncharacterized protein n=1 Tax=Limoniibacter endophyticus TaxID=1565040 RepID=A0A8J3DFX1_9HYPH|nr:hypothetical protein [Limoniibacter endophyticus]GHC61642.1 hypothetical protein GCM10010136_02310 [Limoniibacter endophyticus]